MGLDRLIGFDPQLLYEMFWTAINIFILFFGLSYLLFNPVRDMLEKRKQKIAGELADAANDKKSAAEMKAEYEQKLKEVSKEADARIIDRGNREVELERKKALDDMKQEIVSIASLMAEKVVASSINMKVQDELIEETLKEMGESTWQS